MKRRPERTASAVQGTRQLAAFAMVYLFAWFGALYGLPELPEHELQLFMASHYMESPFSLSDVRWYGGVDVAWRPPAFYVCTALLGKAVGLERAYALMVIGSAVGFAFAFAALFRAFAPFKHDAAMLFAVNPVLFVFAFGLGQSAFVAALALVAVQGAYKGVPGFLAAALAPLVHPLALPLVALVGMATRRKEIIGALALAGVVLIPFFHANSEVGSGPVSHNKWLLVASVIALSLLAKWERYATPVLVALSAYVLGDHASAAPVRRYREAVAAAEYALSKPEAAGHRYLALGLGTERLALSRKTTALLADGGINWLNNEPKLDDPTIKWVVSADPTAEQALRENGFRLAAAWGGGVVFWEKDTQTLFEPPPARPAPWWWTVSGPLLAFLLALSLSAHRFRWRLQRQPR